MRALLGPVGAFGAFVLAFVLHIVGGATDQDWLFTLAVIAIFGVAASFPVISVLLGRPRVQRDRRLMMVVAALVGTALMAATLWATNDRAWAVWTLPFAIIVAAVGTAAAGLLQRSPNAAP